MASSNPFEFVCEKLETATSLSSLEARGTVRLALKRAGFDARSVGAEEMAVVARKVLPEELSLRAVADAAELCARIAGELGAGPFRKAPDQSAPEAVFRRLGGA